MTFYLLAFLGLLASPVHAYTWPNHAMDEVEHLLVDTGGFNDGGFRRAITPCTNYVSGSQLLGRETAAQWIRVAFHDFATADVAAGTGGIDASIGLETLRPENSGSAMNDSLGFFAPFVNAYRSTADMIALSVVMSIGGCSTPSIHVPLRVGRIDATEPGEFGVPEPETSIEETLAQFEKAGFNQVDAIGLTACGHTMGSVHHGGFPQVVNDSAVTPTNQGGGIHFDATPDVFDIDVVQEYLSGTGQQGGALVTTPNVTVRSDLRIYTSDNNATMRQLSTSSETFISTCVSLMSRMIDTVPSTTKLTEPIVPPVVKPVNVSLSLDENGTVQFSGFIRILSTAFSSNATVRISWLSRTGVGAPAFVSEATFVNSGDGIFGTTYYHFFSTPINATSGISIFFVTVKDAGKTKTFVNGGSGFPVGDIAFYLPSQSTIGDDGSVSITSAVLTAAQASSVTALFAIPSPQQGTLAPQILKSSLKLSPGATLGAYTLYTASAQLPLWNIEQTSVDIIAETKHGIAKDEFKRLRAQ